MNQMLRVRGSRTIQIQSGTVLSGFKLAQQIPIPELNVVGLHFVHEQTKMQYYHYVSPEDTNNVFCIGFNTPNPNSKGLPHILEHTTLCGSQKYPVRDPFFYMLKRSLNTFMNAMTGPSYTIYPFSTVNERDFMNLLGVYLDAVFQPLLKKRDFMQEGHRFEFEGKDNGEDKNIDLETLTLKGVVYNEMKGALENPASFFYSKLCEHALSETSYEHVLGGCPSVIPDLTHEELLAYHADHYHPTNAVVVTYGDLDFTAHMSIMDDALKGMGPKVRHSIPLLPAEYTAASKGVVMDEGPLDVMGDAERSTRVVVSWVVPSKYFKEDQPVEDICFHYLTFEILSTLLTNGPASPMYKALIDTHMGTDFTPSNGFEQDFRNPLFSFGLQGVNLGQCDEVKIQNAVLEALRKAHAEGFDHDLVDAVVHQIQLSKRHRSSAFGLNLSYASVLNNLQSGSVFPFLMTMASLEKIRNLHKENKMYFSNLIASLFLEVSPRVTMVLKADKDHTEKRREQELHRIQQKKASLTDEEAQAILKMGQELAEAQNHKPDLSCLPTLKRSDIATSVVPEQRGQIHKFGAKSSAEIIIAACNQLVYSNILIPLDLANFSRDELLLLPTYASLLCSVGAGEYDYEALSTKTERLCSGFDVSIHVAAYPDMKRLLCGLYVQFHALSERHSDALQLLETIFQQVRFDKDDEKVVSRVISLVSSCATSMIQSVPHNGHRYAMAAAAARISPVCRLSCSMEGLEQIVYLKSILDDLTSETAGLAQQRAQSILKDLREIHRKVCTLHAAETWYVCEESEQSLVVEKSLKFLSRVVNESAPEAVNPVQYNSDAYQKPSFVSVSTPGEVCYLSLAMPSNTLYGAKDSAIQQVAFKVLGNEFLHREIREKGGAYGSGASSRPSGNLSFALAMFSYRDPTPLRSFLVMCRGVQEYLCDAQQIEERTVDEALLSMFGMMDAPRTPSSYGTHWYLSRMDDALRQQHRSNLLATTKEDICACVRSLAQNIVDKNVVCVCLGNADLLKPAQGSAEERGMQEWNVSWTAKEY